MTPAEQVGQFAKCGFEQYEKQLDQLRAENSALKAELAEAKKDAERLTWLEHQNSNIDKSDAWCITRCDFTDMEDPLKFWVGSDLRSAIDEAMKGK